MKVMKSQHLTIAALALGFGLVVQGCSLLLDTTDCTTDNDCTRFASDGETARCVNNGCLVEEAPECTTNEQCAADEICSNQTCTPDPSVMVEPDMKMDADPVDMKMSMEEEDMKMAVEPDMKMEADPDMGPETVIIEGTITGTQNQWTSDKVYVLRGLVYVADQAILNIGAGTKILGEPLSALIVQRGGRLLANGNKNAPVVFTSTSPEGERLTGDWGGVAMLGRAPVNKANAILEGVPETEESKVIYGGSDPESSCGKLEYVRVEFAGYAIKPNKELNGLTLAGCGSDTLIDHVQVHFGNDDGLEIFGGSVDIKHVVLSRAQDDSLDIDLGWTGRGQFITIQQDSGGEVDRGIEASSSKTGLTPRTAPAIYNVTMVAPLSATRPAGILFKEDVGGTFGNMIFLSHPKHAINISGEESAALAQAMPEELVVRDSLFYDIGADSVSYWPVEEVMTPADDDGGFDEGAYFTQMKWSNTFGTDPMLRFPYDLLAPDFTPTSPSAVSGAGVPIDTRGVPAEDFFDDTATYYGSISPTQENWMEGWTSFPEN